MAYTTVHLVRHGQVDNPGHVLYERMPGFHLSGRGRRIGHGEGALWKNGNWRLVLNLWRPSWGESYKAIVERVSDFVYEQVDRYPGGSMIAVTHESPIWSFRHMLEKGRPEHNMLLRRTALASVTSLTFEAGTHRVMNIAYCDPAAGIS